MRIEIQTCDGCGIEHPGDSLGAAYLGTGSPMMPCGSWIGITFGARRDLDYGVDQDMYLCSLDCLMIAARKLRGFTVAPEVDPLELAFATPAVEPARRPKPTKPRKPRTPSQ